MATRVSDEEEFAAYVRSIRDQIPYETGNYPYVTARVKAKKAFLYSTDTYARLLQMEIPQIARFLGEGAYKEEIVALGGRLRGVDLIERATADNLAKVFQEIIRWSEGGLRDMVAGYLDRWDVSNIKTVLRGKLYGAPLDEILEDLVAAGSLDETFLRDLAEKETVDEVFRALEGTIYAEARKEVGEAFDPATNFAVFEDALSHVYYRNLLAAIRPRTDASRFFLEFVRREIDIVNLRTLLRLWKGKGTVGRNVFLDGGLELSSERLQGMISLDLNGLLARLAGYSLYAEIAPALREIEQKGVASVERTLEKSHLKDASRFSHVHPLTVLPVLDFLARKTLEVENIRIIVRGKESGLTNETMRDLLVV